MLRRRLIVVAIAAALVGGAVSIAQATAPGKDGRVAFSRYRYREDVFWSELFTANPNGTDERKLTHSPKGYQDEEPEWSPDAVQVAFTRCPPSQDHCAIWAIDAKSGHEVRLSPYVLPGSNPPKYVEDKFPAYSPDGKRMAFVRYSGSFIDGRLAIADAHLRHARLLRRDIRLGFLQTPVWSPDGRQLVFASGDTPVPVSKKRMGQVLFVVDADGSRLRRLTPWSLRAQSGADWSPDGSRILFLAKPPGSQAEGGQLYTIKPDGAGLRQLTHLAADTNVLQMGSFSPDGKSIVFATTAAAIRGAGLMPDIFVMSADGTDIRPVTRIRNWDGSPDWGPSS